MRRLFVRLMSRLVFVGISKDVVCRCGATTGQCQEGFLFYGVKCCVKCDAYGPAAMHMGTRGRERCIRGPR
jgi:hypothetical protein